MLNLQVMEEACAASVAPHNSAPATRRDLTARSARCWGGLLTGRKGCGPGYNGGPRHFKNHFCGTCRRDGMFVPADRVRALVPGLPEHESFQNDSRQGVWTTMSDLDLPPFRVINQTVRPADRASAPASRAGPGPLARPV
jgi:hypothetical protein